MSIQPETSEPCGASGAFVFLRCGQGAGLTALHASLSTMEGVVGCHLVLGGNIVLRLAAHDREGLKRIVENIEGIAGIADIEMHFCEDAVAGEDGKATSFAILDVESGKAKDLGAQLGAMPGVTRYDVTDGGRRIILGLAGLAGESPREIRNILGGKVRWLPGVLRIKQLNVI